MPDPTNESRGCRAVAWCSRNLFLLLALLRFTVGLHGWVADWLITLHWTVGQLLLMVVIFAHLAIGPLVLGLVVVLAVLYATVALLGGRASAAGGEDGPGARGPRAAGRALLTRLGTAARRGFRGVLMPVGMVAMLTISPTALPAFVLAGTALAWGVSRVRHGAWDADRADRQTAAVQLAGAVATFTALVVNLAGAGATTNPELIELVDEPVYSLGVSPERNALYYGHSENAIGSETEEVAGSVDGSYFARLDLDDGTIVRSRNDLGVAQDFVLDPGRGLLIGFDHDHPEDGLLLLDLDTLEVVARHPLPTGSIQDVAMRPGSRFVHFVAEFQNRLFRFDLDAGTWSEQALASPWGFPNEIVYEPELDTFFVSQWGYGFFLNAIPADDPSHDRWAWGGSWMTGVAVDPVRGRVFVARALHDKIDVVSAATLERLDSLPAPAFVRRIAYDPARDQLYALQYNPGRLIVIDATTGAEKGSHPTPAFGRALLYDRTLDRLFLGTARGLHEVPPAWLGPRPGDRAGGGGPAPAVRRPDPGAVVSARASADAASTTGPRGTRWRPGRRSSRP